MLIQITNNCNECCEHCLQCSQKESEGIQHMSLNTFHMAVNFASSITANLIALSGGEPTLNPQWYEFTKRLNFDWHLPFIIISNGTWIDDEKTLEKINKVLAFRFCVGIQVTSSKEYYPSYNKIVVNQDKFKKLSNKIFLEIDPPIFMEDLGRARNSVKAQEEIEKNPYHMSCLKACLAFKQVNYLKDVGPALLNAHQMCKPCVDWKGNIHMSESWLCPAIGSVRDTPRMIWNKGRDFIPCLKCKNSHKLLKSESKDIIKAREIIFGKDFKIDSLNE